MARFHTTSDGNIPFTAEEEAARDIEELIFTDNVNNQKAAEVRVERNAKLSATDWTQIADATGNKAAWATYRQALRDITAQSGFPWIIKWPDAP